MEKTFEVVVEGLGDGVDTTALESKIERAVYDKITTSLPDDDIIDDEFNVSVTER